MPTTATRSSKARSTWIRWSVTPWASRCRSRPCASRTAWACVRSVAATATWGNAPVTKRLTRGSRCSRTCCPTYPKTRATRKEPDGRPQEEAEQDPHREAAGDLEGGADRVQRVPAVQTAEAATSRVREQRLLR